MADLGQALLQATLLTRLQVETVLLDVLPDPFALHLAAKSTKGLLERLVLTDSDQDHMEAPGYWQYRLTLEWGVQCTMVARRDGPDPRS